MVTWQKLKRDIIPPSRCQADETEEAETIPSGDRAKELPKKAEEISIVVTKSSDAEGDKVDEPKTKIIFPANDSMDQDSSSNEKPKAGECNESPTESVKGKDSVSGEEAAPFNTILDFLSSLLTKNYPEALRLSKTVLKYEPNNKTVAEFLNVLEEVVAGGLLEDQATSSSSSSSSSDSDSSSSSSSSSSESETSGSETEPSDSENDREENILSLMPQRDRPQRRCRLPSSKISTSATTASSSSEFKFASSKSQCHCYSYLQRRLLASAVAAEPSAELVRRSVLNSKTTPHSSDFFRQSLISSGTSSSDSSDVLRHSIIASAMSGSACTHRSFASLPSSTLTPLPSDVNRSLMGSASSGDDTHGEPLVSRKQSDESSSCETTDDGYSS